MLKIVDKTETFTVFKRTAPDGTLIDYLAFETAHVGDSAYGTSCTTLAAARKVIDRTIAPPTTAKTKPKAEYAQCAKGYKANSNRKKVG